jgi:dipeptidyl aminopeptidase/acylaminoacyl peptidase
MPRMADSDAAILARFERARRALPGGLAGLVHALNAGPKWLSPTQGWAQRQTSAGFDVLVIDAETGSVEVLARSDTLLPALESAGGDASPKPTAETIVDIAPDLATITVEHDDAQWRYDVAAATARKLADWEAVGKAESKSPDGNWVAFSRGPNLFVRELATGQVRQLTDDGEPEFSYARPAHGEESIFNDRLHETPQPPSVSWSPDSSRLITQRRDRRLLPKMHLLEQVPRDGACRPKLHSFPYSLVGDEVLAKVTLHLFEVATGTRTDVALPPFSTALTGPTENDSGQWAEDGATYYFTRTTRDAKRADYLAVDATTGTARVLASETAATFVELSPGRLIPRSQVWVRRDGDLIWWSERDDWGHLYLLDGATGAVKRQLTQGAWQVRELLAVDEAAGTALITAGGREPGRNPYYAHLYRLDLASGELTLLTPEDADHTIELSEDKRFFFDTSSRVDLAPVTVLRRADGSLVTTVHVTDIANLLAGGWRAPEIFSAKALDGVTDLWGVLFFPSDFDPTARYPFIEYIYPGPQSSYVPNSWLTIESKSNMLAIKAMAELGFVVGIVDGPGTGFRSKSFKDVIAGRNFGEAGGLADRVSVWRQLATDRPYLDLDRVGIFGHSGGGFATTRALLRFPEFYKVGVASAGNHDQRAYSAGWGEFYLGLLEGDTYEDQANPDLAANLTGKLLLIHGALDGNVYLSTTMRLVQALIDADKDFDLLVLPEGTHSDSFARNPYVLRRHWDYFVRHLRHESPPAAFHITPEDLEV